MIDTQVEPLFSPAPISPFFNTFSDFPVISGWVIKGPFYCPVLSFFLLHLKYGKKRGEGPLRFVKW